MSKGHQISKLIMKMHVPSQEGAYDYLNQTSSTVKRSVIGSINKVLDEFNTEGKTIRIPRIEIDLTEDYLEDIGVELASKIEEKLREELLKIFHGNDLSKVLGERGIRLSTNSIEVTDIETSEAEQLLFYLENGYLPWWAKDQPRLITTVIKQWIHAGPDHPQWTFWTVQFRNLLQQPRALKRLVEQAELPVLEQLTEMLFRDSIKQYWIKQLARSTARPRKVYAEILRLEKSTSLEEWLLDLMDELSGEIQVDQLLRAVLPDTSSFVLLARTILLSRFETEAIRKWFIPYKEKLPLAPGMETLETWIDHFRQVNVPKKQQPGQVDKKNANELKTESKNQEREQNSPVTEDIYIGHAGLVILHPYLSPFFKALQLLHDNQFKDEVSRHYAVRVLHYLATGEEEMPEEHQLVLPKLLCGIDPGEVLLDTPALPELHQEEGHALLESVIENWSVLKRTSVAGLRSTFIQREGRLSYEPNGWSIKIERTTVDVLLDRLPWTISMIKLPWSNEFIYVEW